MFENHCSRSSKVLGLKTLVMNINNSFVHNRFRSKLLSSSDREHAAAVEYLRILLSRILGSLGYVTVDQKTSSASSFPDI